MPPCGQPRRRRSSTPARRRASAAWIHAPVSWRYRAWPPRTRCRTALARPRPCSLDHHHAAGRANRIARLHQSVDFAALLEERRLRRVQVFGLSVRDHAPAEADHGAARAEDREHDAVAKAVVALAFVLDDEAAFHEGRFRILFKNGLQRLPVVRGVADAKARGNFTSQPALLQVLNRFGRLL